MPVEGICEQFGFKDLVNFQTRGDAKLDLALTDISEYQPAKKLPPLARNDHCCVLIDGEQYQNSNYTRDKKRLVTPERKNSFLCDLARTSWDSVLRAPSVHDEATELHKTVNSLLDKYYQKRSTKVRSDRPQWMTNSILKLIKASDEAYHRGCSSYKFLR